MRHPLLSVAENAAREAGDYLRRSFASQKHQVSYKAMNEPVCEADLESGKIIARNLCLASAAHPVVSEEENNGEKEIVIPSQAWIVDPLDGTRNFISGMPIFGIAIAFVENNEPTLSIIYDPIHDELFSAQSGKGAFLNRQPIHVSRRGIQSPGILLAGSGRGPFARERHGMIIHALEQKTPYFRRLGSAAVMLSSVACGRADAVVLTGNRKPWDMVAGALLIEEAGGKVSDFCGNPWKTTNQDMLASNGVLHNDLLAVTSKIHEANCGL